MYSEGYIHRDVRRENMLMGDNKHGNIAYVTDIGLAKETWEPEQHSYCLTSTKHFASIHADSGVDDLNRRRWSCLAQ